MAAQRSDRAGLRPPSGPSAHPSRARSAPHRAPGVRRFPGGLTAASTLPRRGPRSLDLDGPGRRARSARDLNRRRRGSVYPARLRRRCRRRALPAGVRWRAVRPIRRAAPLLRRLDALICAGWVSHGRPPRRGRRRSSSPQSQAHSRGARMAAFREAGRLVGWADARRGDEVIARASAPLRLPEPHGSSASVTPATIDETASAAVVHPSIGPDDEGWRRVVVAIPGAVSPPGTGTACRG